MALVQTDVMVFDRGGNFIDGLKRDQFSLKIDGKSREISFFELVKAGSRSEEAQLAAARGQATGTDGATAARSDARVVGLELTWHSASRSIPTIRSRA